MEAAVAVEVPAVEVRERLVGFVGRWWRRLPHVRQRENALVYVRGLIEQGGRKSLQPTLFRLEETPARYESMQQFLADSPWEPALLVRACAERVAPEIGVLAWVVDDTGIAKDGKHSPGVKRQYSGTLGKIGNCQITVSVHAVGERGTLPLGWRAVSARGVVRGRAAAARRRRSRPTVAFETKPQLAAALVEQAAGWQLPLGADPRRLAPTATTPRFRTRLARARARVRARRVAPRSSVYGPETTLRGARAQRQRPVGRGRSPRPDRKPESVRALAERLPATAWQTLPCRTTPAGEDVTSRFAFVRVVATHPVRSDHQPPREEWLIIEWPEPSRGADRLLALQPARRHARRERLARLARLRWTIELDYRQLKGELGLDHYEGRSYLGFHHHCRARHLRARLPHRSNACARKPRGRPDAAADGAAPAARPALLGRPLPNLPATRRPRTTRPLQPTRVTKQY